MIQNLLVKVSENICNVLLITSPLNYAIVHESSY